MPDLSASAMRQKASPAQLTRLQARLAEGDIRCAFREPQFDDRLLRVAAEGTTLHIGVLDPMGSKLEPGPGLYLQLLEEMANGFTGCADE